MGIRKNRHMIYVGPALSAVLDGRKQPLSQVVGVIAERYAGMLSRAKKPPPYCMWSELYCNVLREVDHPLTSAEIATFPAMCEDWLKRNPEFPPQPSATAIVILNNLSYIDLVALVDRMEKQL